MRVGNVVSGNQGSVGATARCGQVIGAGERRKDRKFRFITISLESLIQRLSLYMLTVVSEVM